jgi:hypothetical protein
MSDEENKRTAWARSVAHHLVDGALDYCAQKPVRDQLLMLREIAKRALEHFAERANQSAQTDKNPGNGNVPPGPSAEHARPGVVHNRH